MTYSLIVKHFIIKNTLETKFQIKLFGIIMFINYPLYFILFDLNHSPDLQTSLILRSIATLLCLGLLFINYNTVNLFKSLYWYFTILYCLPFFFSFMTLFNHVSTIWLMNYMSATFFTILIMDFISSIATFCIGNLLGIICYYLYSSKIVDLGGIKILDIFFTIFAAWIIGSLFSRNNILKQLEKLATLKALGGTIAHELRTPVGALGMKGSGLATQAMKLLDGYKLAREHNLPVKEMSERELKKVENSYQDIKNVTNESLLIIDMLLTKLKDPSAESQKETCSIKQIIEEALDRYPLYENQRDLIYLKLDEDFTFYGNKTMFSHVIFNLLKNALHYIRQENKGEITITSEKNQNENILYFRDTAKGIPSEMLPHMFEKFYSRTEHGTGLGLAFCKLVMEEIGGKITCRSVFGEYTEFVLSFLLISQKNTFN